MFFEHSDFLFPFFITVGVALALVYIFYQIRKLKLSRFTFERLVIIMCFSGLGLYIGARLFDNLFHFIAYNQAIKAGETVSKPSYQGITFLGGYVTAMAVFVTLYFCFLKNELSHFLKLFGIIATGFAIAHCFGRIGCFTAGCCYGQITESFLGIIFPEGSPPYRALSRYFVEHSHSYTDALTLASQTKILPTQLIESTFLLCLFIFLALYKKHQFAIYAISYGLFRFIIEFFRFDNRGRLLGFISPSQTLCILLLITGSYALYYELVKSKKARQKSVTA